MTKNQSVMSLHLISETAEKKLVVQTKFSNGYSVSILGSGVVGETVGKGLAEIGETVTFYDVNQKKIRQLRSEGFHVFDMLDSAILNTDISYFCVPTPATEKGKIDLSYITELAKETGRILKKKPAYHLIVVKSTVLPTSTENVVIPILEEYSEKKAGVGFGVCCNPEFLTEIHNSWTNDESYVRDFSNEPFIVIGEFDRKSGDMLASLYDSLGPPILRTNLKTAEMLKYAFNCALATKISYWNEIFCACRKLGIDSEIIANTASMDPRIGKYGTVHKKAFGGKCLPKDLSALVSFCRENQIEPLLLEAVLDVNQKIKREFGVRE